MARPFNDRDLDDDFYSEEFNDDYDDEDFDRFYPANPDDNDLQDIINQYGDNDGENEATPW